VCVLGARCVCSFLFSGVHGPIGGLQFSKELPPAGRWPEHGTHNKAARWRDVQSCVAQWRARNKGNEVKKTHSKAQNFQQTVPPFIRSLLGGVGCWSLFWFWLVSGLR
jgi:hypothetical protein